MNALWDQLWKDADLYAGRLAGAVVILIVGVIAVLLFGDRLPEVGRSVGKTLMEFKKSLKDIQNEVTSATSMHSSPQVSYRNAIDDYEEPTAPKFEPPAHEPQPAAPPEAQAPKA